MPAAPLGADDAARLARCAQRGKWVWYSPDRDRLVELREAIEP